MLEITSTTAQIHGFRMVLKIDSINLLLNFFLNYMSVCANLLSKSGKRLLKTFGFVNI